MSSRFEWRLPLAPWVFAAPVVCALLVACGDGIDERALELEAERVRQRDLAWYAAEQHHDMDAVMDIVSPGAVIHMSRSTIQGHAEIRDFFARSWEGLIEIEGEPETVEVARCGDMAYSTGWERSVRRAGSDTKTYEHKYIVVWKKSEEGVWQAVAASVSGNRLRESGS